MAEDKGNKGILAATLAALAALGGGTWWFTRSAPNPDAIENTHIPTPKDTLDTPPILTDNLPPENERTIPPVEAPEPVTRTPDTPPVVVDHFDEFLIHVRSEDILNLRLLFMTSDEMPPAGLFMRGKPVVPTARTIDMLITDYPDIPPIRIVDNNLATEAHISLREGEALGKPFTVIAPSFGSGVLRVEMIPDSDDMRLIDPTSGEEKGTVPASWLQKDYLELDGLWPIFNVTGATFELDLEDYYQTGGVIRHNMVLQMTLDHTVSINPTQREKIKELMGIPSSEPGGGKLMSDRNNMKNMLEVCAIVGIEGTPSLNYRIFMDVSEDTLRIRGTSYTQKTPPEEPMPLTYRSVAKYQGADTVVLVHAILEKAGIEIYPERIEPMTTVPVFNLLQRAISYASHPKNQGREGVGNPIDLARKFAERAPGVILTDVPEGQRCEVCEIDVSRLRREYTTPSGQVLEVIQDDHLPLDPQTEKGR